MARAQFRILFTLLALGFLGSIVFGAYYLYQKEFLRDKSAKERIKERGVGPPPDPGKNKFAQAIGLLRTGDLAGGRGRLFEVLRHYKDSSKYSDAKRIIGEINMDALMEPELGPGKKEYIVQRGDSLSKIASKNQTTIDCIQRANGMLSTLLHPGDRLIVFPLDFSIVVDIGSKSLTLMKKGRFFKEYSVLEARIPPGVRVPFESTVGDKAAWAGGRRVNFMSSRYLGANKWLQLKKGRIVIYSEDPNPDVPEEELPLGIFLDPADMEELFTIIRTSTPVTVVK